MEKEFVPYELALKMKQLGFDEPCFGYWYTEQEEYKKIDIQLATIDFLEGEEDYILALTWQQAFRWFREKYQLQSEIFWITDMNCFWYKTGKFKYGSRDLSKDGYKTYEKAELVCLEKLIEIVEQIKSE
jgi:hypothetical protein